MDLRGKLKKKYSGITQKRVEQHRQRMGEELAAKEKLLAEREVSLNQREKDISRREEKLGKYYLIPRLAIQLPLFVALCIGAVLLFLKLKPESATGEVSATGNGSQSLSTT